MSPQFWWFLTRSSGIVAWLMLTLSVIWGILLSTKAFPEQRRPQWLLALHRWLAGLTLSFLAIHLVALVADSYVSFGLADITVPFASDWKPGAVALGVLGAWLLVAVELTSLAMRRLPRRFWRAVHLSSYVAFWLTSLHAAFAGTDTTSWLYRGGAAASILAVGWALMYRVTNRRSVRRAARALTAGTTADREPGLETIGRPCPVHNPTTPRTNARNWPASTATGASQRRAAIRVLVGGALALLISLGIGRLTGSAL